MVVAPTGAVPAEDLDHLGLRRQKKPKHHARAVHAHEEARAGHLRNLRREGVHLRQLDDLQGPARGQRLPDRALGLRVVVKGAGAAFTHEERGTVRWARLARVRVSQILQVLGRGHYRRRGALHAAAAPPQGSQGAQAPVRHGGHVREAAADAVEEHISGRDPHATLLERHGPRLAERALPKLLQGRGVEERLHVVRVPLQHCQRLPQRHPIPIPLVKVVVVPRQLNQRFVPDGTRRAVGQSCAIYVPVLEHGTLCDPQLGRLQPRRRLAARGLHARAGDPDVLHLDGVPRCVERLPLVIQHRALNPLPRASGVGRLPQGVDHLDTMCLGALRRNRFIVLVHRGNRRHEAFFARPGGTSLPDARAQARRDAGLGARSGEMGHADTPEEKEARKVPRHHDGFTCAKTTQPERNGSRAKNFGQNA
mmetsp:Transcript_66697/g.204040  ORF Transcript_66697/g.204040 Transcript_66697/m.204040 type:complete len:423 (-) Transcript_66697:28-1296(-)